MNRYEKAARALARRYNARLILGTHGIDAKLPGGMLWAMSDTDTLITERGSGETMANVWRDMWMQMSIGVYTTPAPAPGRRFEP
jgi:hypothetical protein